MVMVRPRGGHDRAKERKRNKGTLHQKSDNDSMAVCIFAFGDSHDTSLILPETLQMTALPSSPLYLVPAPNTYTLHVVPMDIYLHTSGYSSAQGIFCACVS